MLDIGMQIRKAMN